MRFRDTISDKSERYTKLFRCPTLNAQSIYLLVENPSLRTHIFKPSTRVWQSIRVNNGDRKNWKIGNRSKTSIFQIFIYRHFWQYNSKIEIRFLKIKSNTAIVDVIFFQSIQNTYIILYVYLCIYTHIICVIINNIRYLHNIVMYIM